MRGAFSLVCAGVIALAAATGVVVPPGGAPGSGPAGGLHRIPAPSDGCVTCHGAIEDMHPQPALSCVDCHGGNGAAATADAAHVRPPRSLTNDERTVGQDFEPEYRRFINPSDLRVAAKVCGECHGTLVSDVKKSLHGTTAGHLSDGLYENGVVKKRGTSFAIFPVADDDGVKSPHAVAALGAIPGFRAGLPAGDIATHYADVARKSCMQCHLWSRGRAVRGRLGMDGDYRSEGCAARHVTYSDTGFSQSDDVSINHKEPGHPLRHRFTSKIPTDTCTRCHYGDASIGLSFRGLAQLVPGQPGGPDVPGTTARRQNGQFYMRDDGVTPADIHHARGLACIDCHTARDAMGDGDILPVMDHAVEITCEACHGTATRPADFRTAAGRLLKHLSRDAAGVWLTSKVTGARHRVKQAVDVVNPYHSDFNAGARDAMTTTHDALECYACHAGWNANFFGFHFDRNETFAQLDVLSGQRTPGRVTTQEKVFASFRQLTLGRNENGRWAPFMVGFSTFCTATDKTGRVVIDQGMPRTGAGLSGMTMIHHQPHTTQAVARGCADCHRAGSTWGLGSGSFDLARGLVGVVSSRGLTLAAVDRRALDQSVALVDIRVDGARSVAFNRDAINGFADTAFVATPDGITVVTTANPAFPTVRAKLALEGGARHVLATDRHLFVTTGRGSVAIVDVADVTKPRLASLVPLTSARGMALGGLHLFVADGPRGLTVVDVADPHNPAIVTNMPLGQVSITDPGDRGADCVAVMFQYSRPLPQGGRTAPRQLAAVGGTGIGLFLIDVTEPGRPRVLLSSTAAKHASLAGNNRIVAVALGAKFDLGSTGGAIPTAENDYLYALTANGGRDSALEILRVSDPTAPTFAGRVGIPGTGTDLALMRLYNQPFLTHAVAVAGTTGLRIVDVTRIEQPMVKANISDIACTGGLAVEAMPLDRMITEEGVALKDVAHEGARYATAAEMRRMLAVPLTPRLLAPPPKAASRPASRPTSRSASRPNRRSASRPGTPAAPQPESAPASQPAMPGGHR